LPYPDQGSFCKALAEAVCNSTVVSACYGATDDLSEETTSCVTAYRNPEVCNPYGYSYRAEGAEACISALTSLYSDGKLTSDEMDSANDACLAVYSAGGAVGTACEADHVCDAASGLRCVTKPGATGSCQQPEEVLAGGNCAGDNQVCEAGYYCNQDANLCGIQPTVAEACSDTMPCDATSLCEGEICIAKTGNGETCSVGSQCAGGLCDKTAGADTGSCVEVLSLYTNSEACTAFK